MYKIHLKYIYKNTTSKLFEKQYKIKDDPNYLNNMVALVNIISNNFEEFLIEYFSHELPKY